ncbi:PDC sensor domain-containing protein [Leucothrix arctica]|uniref:General glycosylation pathway protein n=1 Tax=Leucothrix arctica TaxID=1481894 RepID=A0A317CLT5_9GAMM|nr:PDC sensor domain-containing protein [Leucothrix arctica]PWQ99339.1 general glycosylation pathway protein [Leucothrix arctica]
MADMSYVHIIDYYHLHTESINELMDSILSGVNDASIYIDADTLQSAMSRLEEKYPFVSMLYTLDPDGKQNSPNISPNPKLSDPSPIGKDRSHRPYFVQTNEDPTHTITSPYLSISGRSLCVSVMAKVYSDDREVIGYIVLDASLTEVISFMMGDQRRRQFNGVFKCIYAAISIGLFCVVGILFYFAMSELVSIFTAPEGETVEHYAKPFGTIIYLTLALAIFDLAKTTLEEEVLMHKDIFRHSSTRRTITRFMAAILVAVSIEALVLMFKSVMSDSGMLTGAVMMLLAAAALLLSLGAYVYLGAKAEVLMLESNQPRPRR